MPVPLEHGARVNAMAATAMKAATAMTAATLAAAGRAFRRCLEANLLQHTPRRSARWRVEHVRMALAE